jgi:TolA-binding protein
MSDKAREAWATLKEHPLRAVAATLAGLLMSLVAWNGSRALSAIDQQTSAIAALDKQVQMSIGELDKKTQEAIGSLREDLGSVRTDIARMQTLYQAQVPDIVQRVAEVEKAIRVLRWELEMEDYREDKVHERAERTSKRKATQARGSPL